MIQINLLPSTYKSKKKGVKEFVVLYFISVLVILLAVGYLWYDQRQKLEDLKTRLAQLERQVKDFANYEKTLQELQAKKQVVATKTKVVENLGRDRDRMVRLMAVLAVSVPTDQIWFERVNESQNGITIDGVAKSDDAIVEFMRNLQNSPYIANGSVGLRYSREGKGGLRQFQLSCSFVPFSAIGGQVAKEEATDSQKPKKGKKKKAN